MSFLRTAIIIVAIAAGIMLIAVFRQTGSAAVRHPTTLTSIRTEREQKAAIAWCAQYAEEMRLERISYDASHTPAQEPDTIGWLIQQIGRASANSKDAQASCLQAFENS